MKQYKLDRLITRCVAWFVNSPGRPAGFVSIVLIVSIFACGHEDHDMAGDHIVFRADSLCAFLLPDSSIVTVNKGGVLVLSHDFGDSTREMSLQGEAYFEVKHDPRRKFIVHCNTVTTTVLGTAFGIKLLPRIGDVTVTVTQGRVNVSDATHDYGTVGARQQVVVTPALHKAYHAYVNVNQVLEWYYATARPANSNLTAVIAVLRDKYNADIILENDGLNDCIVTINPDFNEKLDDILQVLARSVNAHIEKREGAYIMLGGACD
jgi:transmembrane sensor